MNPFRWIAENIFKRQPKVEIKATARSAHPRHMSMTMDRKHRPTGSYPSVAHRSDDANDVLLAAAVISSMDNGAPTSQPTSEFSGNGGDFGGAGASSNWDSPSVPDTSNYADCGGSSSCDCGGGCD